VRRLAHSSVHSVGSPLPSGNQFQALRDLLETYPDSESCSSASAPPCRVSFEPLSISGDVQLKDPLSHNQQSAWVVYHHKKNLRKGEVSLEEENVSLRRSEYMAAEEGGLQPGGQIVQTMEETPLSNGGNDHFYNRGLACVMDHIIPMCKRMGLAIEGRETELFAFLASLEANKKIRSQAVDQFGVDEAVGKEDIV